MYVGKVEGSLRLRSLKGPRVASSTAHDFNGPKMPFVLVRSVTLIILSSAAEVGGGEGLLRGHGCCYVQKCLLEVCRRNGS
jgi:hypothetical protein